MATSVRVIERLREVVRGTAEAFGVEVDLDIDEGFPVLSNDSDCAEVVARIGQQVLGEAQVSSEGLPIAGGEDFAYYAEQRPAAFFFLGARREGEQTATCHHPDFDFDDDLIPLGIEVFLRIVADRLTNKQAS